MGLFFNYNWVLFCFFANLKPWTIRSNDTELSSRATGSVLDFWHTGQICQICECMWMCVYLFLLLYTHCSSVQHFLEVTCYLWSVGAMRSEPQQVKLFSLSVTSVTVPTAYTSALSTSCQTSVLITASFFGVTEGNLYDKGICLFSILLGVRWEDWYYPKVKVYSAACWLEAMGNMSTTFMHVCFSCSRNSIKALRANQIWIQEGVKQCQGRYSKKERITHSSFLKCNAVRDLIICQRK